MFFFASKIIDWFLDPQVWLFLIQFVALWMLLRKKYRAAAAVLSCSIVLAVTLTQLPVAAMVIRPLEQAIRPSAFPDRVDGIIVLGGAIDPILSAAHGRPQLNGDAERLTEFVALAIRLPHAKLVFSGGSADLWGRNTTEAEVARTFFADMGIDPRRIVFEDRSRTTAEHPRYIRELVEPQPGEHWVLITSASHMPRAYAVFRKAGWDVSPYPVSYRATPQFTLSLLGDRSRETLYMAIHEWAGIAAYWMTGKL